MRAARPFVWLMLSALAGPEAAAQKVEVAAHGAAVTNSEIGHERQARGLGVGADVTARLGRVRLVARGLTASLRADFTVQPDYALHQLEAVAIYDWAYGLSVQAGLGRRFVDPEFVSQEVGLMRVGLRSESRLTSFAGIHASASYLPVTRFSGGGGSDLALELGLGLRLGRETGRLAGMVEYTYQRIDRDVNGIGAPIRFSVARVGASARL